MAQFVAAGAGSVSTLARVVYAAFAVNSAVTWKLL